MFVCTVALVTAGPTSNIPRASSRHLHNYWNILNRYIDTVECHTPPTPLPPLAAHGDAGDGLTGLGLLCSGVHHSVGLVVVARLVQSSHHGDSLTTDCLHLTDTARPAGCLRRVARPGSGARPGQANITNIHYNWRGFCWRAQTK